MKNNKYISNYFITTASLKEFTNMIKTLNDIILNIFLKLIKFKMMVQKKPK